jgi:uncharacterized protein
MIYVHRHRPAIALFAVLAIASPAHAASFDCARAVSPLEHKICADPALSAADEALARAWRDALAATLDRPALRDEQRQWRHDPNATAAELETAWRRRVAELNAAAAAWRAVPRGFATVQLNTSCFVTPETDTDLTCRVDESGAVAGDPALSYQLQSLFDGTLRMSGGAVVFSAAANRLTPLLAAHGDTAHYNRPEVVPSPAGPLLWIPGHIEGTGNFNAEQLHLLRDGEWDDIDTTFWQADMARRLPKGRYAAKGIYPDYRTMNATTPLWRPGDANCCPTGGRAAVRLGLRDRRLVIEDLKVTPGKSAAK